MNRFRMVWAACVIGVLVAGAAGGDAPPPLSTPPLPPASGTYAGEGLTLTLKRSGNEYSGTATLEGRTFDLRGTFDPAKGVSGSFVSGHSTFAWSAVSDGRMLRFETGGTEYRLAVPAPAEENPLAKKPTGEKVAVENPLARRPDAGSSPQAGAPAGALKFSRLSIKDPGINNIEAFSFLIPEGWKTEGGIQWFPDLSVLANLLMTVTDSRTGAQIQFLPLQNFTWIERPVVPMQTGTNYMGSIVHQPVRDPGEFVRMFYGTRALPQLAQARQVRVENLQKVADQVARGYGGQSQVVAARVRYEYERAGRAWEEDVYVTMVFTSTPQMTLWSVGSAYSFRAAKGELDGLVPLMATTVSTAHMSQDWYSGYMYVQQLFMNRMNQGIKNAAAISATITRNSEEIRQKFSESYKLQCDTQDRVSRNFSEYIRGVEPYHNPYEGKPVELPSGYQNAWASASGEYILSGQAGFDPNVGSTVEWRRMERAP